ncbi:MAG: cysteine hydrolase [Deltaproteobacteria bacterium]|nr:cysteine hydrolase [Deltaproteobacteria bacterium]
MNRALLLIDLQNDYFPHGRMELVGAEAAVSAAARVLGRFRAAGEPVVHIQHVSVQPGATFFLPGTEGLTIHPSVAPLLGETILTKHFPNSFRDTGLHAHFQGLDLTELVVCGMMSHMCVDTTVRAAFDLGYTVTLVPAACATRDLVFEGQTIPAAAVHGAYMAALGSVFAALRRPDDPLPAG